MFKRKSIIKLEIFNALFILIGGTLLHFLFEFSNNNSFIALFSAINESIWEHLKLLFFPSLITTLFGFIYLKQKNYLKVKLEGTLIALIFIVIFYYTYSGIIGKNFLILDISSFFMAIILEESYTIKNFNKTTSNNYMSLFIFIIIVIIFFIFTFYPPHIGLFKDPLTKQYGIIKT